MFAILAVFVALAALWAMASVALLNWRSPEESALMEIRLQQAEDAGKTLKIRHKIVPLKSISPYLRAAIVVAEDGAFFSHYGFDFYEIQVAVKKGQEKGRIVRGASTITQQLAKNLYLSPERSFMRKGLEAGLTVLLELFLSKERILELYLNYIEWGNGVFGCETAARTYFGRSCAELSLEQAVRLASITINPRRYAVNDERETMIKRRRAIAERLKNTNAINEIEYAALAKAL